MWFRNCWVCKLVFCHPPKFTLTQEVIRYRYLTVVVASAFSRKGPGSNPEMDYGFSSLELLPIYSPMHLGLSLTNIERPLRSLVLFPIIQTERKRHVNNGYCTHMSIATKKEAERNNIFNNCRTGYFGKPRDNWPILICPYLRPTLYLASFYSLNFPLTKFPPTMLKIDVSTLAKTKQIPFPLK